MPMKLHEEEQIDDPPRRSQFGGKSREEWMRGEIERLQPRLLEQERERRNERLVVWPIVAALGTVGLIFVGLVVIPLIDRIGEVLHELLIRLFGSPEMALLGIFACALVVVLFRKLTSDMRP